MKLNRIVISGGGTGGHIFPAIAIANEIKRRNPEVNILFIGAKGKMEMEKVPQAGYNIVGLPIVGFQRKISFSNLLLPFKLIWSLWKAYRLLKKMKPQAVIGVGGYASGPTLKAATWLGLPTIVQEQNSFPGKTNQMLGKKVKAICTAYEGLETFFPSEKITLTGNPVRNEVAEIKDKEQEAQDHFGLVPKVPTVLIMGGSLGARTLNQSVLNHIQAIKESNIQFIWQCGNYYYQTLHEEQGNSLPRNVHLTAFLERMDLAYAAADIIISRAGAISISELCLIGKPIILVPSPNVAEDHQTKNAVALVEKDAAILISDNVAIDQLIPSVIRLLDDDKQMEKLRKNISSLGKPYATQQIVDVIEQVATKP